MLDSPENPTPEEVPQPEWRDFESTASGPLHIEVHGDAAGVEVPDPGQSHFINADAEAAQIHADPTDSMLDPDEIGPEVAVSINPEGLPEINARALAYSQPQDIENLSEPDDSCCVILDYGVDPLAARALTTYVGLVRAKYTGHPDHQEKIDFVDALERSIVSRSPLYAEMLLGDLVSTSTGYYKLAEESKPAIVAFSDVRDEDIISRLVADKGNGNVV